VLHGDRTHCEEALFRQRHEEELLDLLGLGDVRRLVRVQAEVEARPPELPYTLADLPAPIMRPSVACQCQVVSRQGWPARGTHV